MLGRLSHRTWHYPTCTGDAIVAYLALSKKPPYEQHFNRRYGDFVFNPLYKTGAGLKPGQWVPNHRNWDLGDNPTLDIYLSLLNEHTGSEVFYDIFITDVNPLYPKMGPVTWREIGLTIPNAYFLPQARLLRSGRIILHGTHVGNSMSIFDAGQLLQSHDPERHEFTSCSGENGALFTCALTDPNFEPRYHKDACYYYATNTHLGTREDGWNLDYDYTLFAEARDDKQEPLLKMVLVLAETEQGNQNRMRAKTSGNRDWAWSYPELNDYTLLYARLMVGLPPQPESFRLGDYVLDEDAYEGMSQRYVYDTNPEGCGT